MAPHGRGSRAPDLAASTMRSCTRPRQFVTAAGTAASGLEPEVADLTTFITVCNELAVHYRTRSRRYARLQRPRCTPARDRERGVCACPYPAPRPPGPLRAPLMHADEWKVLLQFWQRIHKGARYLYTKRHARRPILPVYRRSSHGLVDPCNAVLGPRWHHRAGRIHPET